LERGRALIEESIGFGVTHMRAFVEVDSTVGMKCLEAGLALKKEFKQRCHVQICAFAQDPIFSQEDDGEKMTKLMEAAAAREGVDVIGSTPYVEKTPSSQRANIEWIIELARKQFLHVDFHLDYNLDRENEPTVYRVIRELLTQHWDMQKNVTLGHCTRLTLFTAFEWRELHNQIGDWPISFVGLPTSDIFMMGRPDENVGGGERTRGTLQIPQMIKEYRLQGAIGVNNVGNAFTPQGSCDPFSVASLGVGIYQAGTKADAEVLMVSSRGLSSPCVLTCNCPHSHRAVMLLLDKDVSNSVSQQCISTRAKMATGLGVNVDIEIKEGDPADLVAFGAAGGFKTEGFRHKRTVSDLVYEPCRERMTVYAGVVVSR
jgi:hypothetical protein